MDTTSLSNDTVLSAQVLPYVDGIAGTTLLETPAAPIVPIFTFSASQDPGARAPPISALTHTHTHLCDAKKAS